MKRFAAVCTLVAALLCVAQSAVAQYRPTKIHRVGTHFKADGHTLSNSELIDLVGEDIYEETVRGARVQMKIGTGLIWLGVACVGAGLAGAVYTGYVAVNEYNYDSFWEAVKSGKEVYSLYSKVAGVLTFGTSAIGAGIPIHIIGRSRLNWVENNYNENARDISCNLGLTPSGVGLVLTF